MKNIELQNSTLELESKFLIQMSEDIYQDLKEQHQRLSYEKDQLIIENHRLKLEYKLVKEECENYKCWRTIDEQAFIGLKHLIVDLQATSDDKATIAKLSFDIEMLRKCELECRSRMELMEEERKLFWNTRETCVNPGENKEQLNKLMDELKVQNRFVGFSSIAEGCKCNQLTLPFFLVSKDFLIVGR